MSDQAHAARTFAAIRRALVDQHEAGEHDGEPVEDCPRCQWGDADA